MEIQFSTVQFPYHHPACYLGMHRNILILKYLKTALEMDLVSIKDEGEDEGQVDERNF